MSFLCEIHTDEDVRQCVSALRREEKCGMRRFEHGGKD